MKNCWLFHNWNNWKTIKEDRLVDVNKRKKNIGLGYFILQERICKNCNKKEQDMQTNDFASAATKQLYKNLKNI